MVHLRKFELAFAFLEGKTMKLSQSEQAVIRAAMPEMDPVEEFAVANRDVFHGLHMLMAEESERLDQPISGLEDRAGSLVSDIKATQLPLPTLVGGSSQLAVLYQLARENGLRLDILVSYPSAKCTSVVRVDLTDM